MDLLGTTDHSPLTAKLHLAEDQLQLLDHALGGGFYRAERDANFRPPVLRTTNILTDLTRRRGVHLDNEGARVDPYLTARCGFTPAKKSPYQPDTSQQLVL